jgi:hypothetical protein
MREWNLHAGNPLALILASDARLGATDYFDDQIWELKIGTGDPAALSLNTTYGLRARSARLFPRFSEGEIQRTDPAEFSSAPEIHSLYPNWISLTFSPFPDIDVLAEYWVPHSHAIAGRLTVTNSGKVGRRLQLELIGQLNPVDGVRMAPFEMSAATLLAGYTGGLAPVLFMTGGAKAGSGPYPSLALTMQMEPDNQRQIIWVQAGLAERELSFAMARELASQNWEAIKSRIEMLNTGNVEIFTGDASWDAAFMLSQKQAASLLVGPTPHLPHISFVLTRQPDQGFSMRGDGSDYSHLWNGQPLMEAAYLADTLLPSAPEIVKDLVRNYLAVQTEEGSIDWKPGLGGQRSRLLAPPLLASLVWRIYKHTEDQAFLDETLAPLRRFFQSWLTRSHDRDGDGIPEWDHTLQAGLDYHPVYSAWQTISLGVDISAAESPALSALLYGECQALLQIAEQTGRQAEVESLAELAENIHARVEAAWQAEEAGYFDVDRITHQSAAGELILEAKGSGSFQIQHSYPRQVRLSIQVRTDETIRRRPLLFLHGKNMSGDRRVERINDDQFRWIPGLGQLTGKYVYSYLERLEVRNLEPDDQISVRGVNFHTADVTALAPLWAGIPESERADKLVEQTITNPSLFWRSFGLPSFPHPEEQVDQTACWSMNLPWNRLVIEGLVRYGYRELAAQLLTRQLAAIVKSLAQERTFRRAYHADSGAGLGEYSALSGIAPVGLFLETLGVRLISHQKVALAGINPYPWPVTVKYRGLTILRQKEQTIVIFPDNQTVTVTDPAPRLVALQADEDFR